MEVRKLVGNNMTVSEQHKVYNDLIDAINSFHLTLPKSYQSIDRKRITEEACGIRYQLLNDKPVSIGVVNEERYLMFLLKYGS